MFMRGNHKEMTCFDLIYFVAKYPLVQTRYNIQQDFRLSYCTKFADTEIVGWFVMRERNANDYMAAQ